MHNELIKLKDIDSNRHFQEMHINYDLKHLTPTIFEL